MNWQQWILPAVTFLLGAVFGLLLAEAKRKQLSDRVDELHVALLGLADTIQFCDPRPDVLAMQLANTLRGARKALGHDPQTSE